MSHLNPSLDQFEKSSNVTKDVSYYIQGIVEDQDRFILSEAITLLESKQLEHRELAYQILASCPQGLSTDRIAVTGSPGVGKSTFIDQLGTGFLNSGKKVAVLTIDPSSSFTQGSILGDKARMMELAKSDDIFIRPSPSSLHLGGVHQYTYEAILLCEAAGYNHIIIETVGVGQSEIEVHQYTELVILLILPGGGDSLQGIKKGIMETADLIIVHKADGDRMVLAEAMQKELNEAQHAQANEATPIILHSSLENNVEELILKLNGLLISKKSNRDKMHEYWLYRRLLEYGNEILSTQLNLILQKAIVAEEDSKTVFETYQSMIESLQIEVKLKAD